MSNKSKFFFIDCSKAADCCNKSQYNEAKFFDKVRLMLHLAFCKTCRRFASKNSKLTSLMEKSRIQTCPDEKKKQWREEIKKELVEERS